MVYAWACLADECELRAAALPGLLGLVRALGEEDIGAAFDEGGSEMTFHFSSACAQLLGAEDARAVDSSSRLQLTAPLVGVLRAMLMELPGRVAAVRHVDVERRASLMQQGGHLLQQLATEVVLCGGEEREVAYRQGRRRAPRLSAVSLWAVPALEEASLVREGASYVVTGGLGGVGVCVCRRLLEGIGTRVVAVGRSHRSQEQLLEAGLTSGRASYVCSALESGEQQAVGDALLAASSIAAPSSSWSAVLHLAGAYAGGAVAHLTEASWREGTQAKVEGSVVLHEAMASSLAAAGDAAAAVFAGLTEIVAMVASASANMDGGACPCGCAGGAGG